MGETGMAFPTHKAWLSGEHFIHLSSLLEPIIDQKRKVEERGETMKQQTLFHLTKAVCVLPCEKASKSADFWKSPIMLYKGKIYEKRTDETLRHNIKYLDLLSLIPKCYRRSWRVVNLKAIPEFTERNRAFWRIYTGLKHLIMWCKMRRALSGRESPKDFSSTVVMIWRAPTTYLLS